MKVIIWGGDGFCGWPTALHLSNLGHEVLIADNLSRRMIDIELEVDSLTPIAPMSVRLEAWHEVSGKTIQFCNIDAAQNYHRVLTLIKEFKPDTMVHFAEQRAAPYSMKSSFHKRYTVDNNINATHNLLAAVVESGLNVHMVHLGTMGVYGYGDVGAKLPEGYLSIQFKGDNNQTLEREILYPASPGSVYHMTKCMDQILFAYYAKNDKLRVTDLHQGIVWGTQTKQTMLDERLINRFDYDGDYGTVLNRFLMQAAINHPLTVHGSGGQTRGFIHIQDTVRCIELAISNPPATGDRVMILNQLAETRSVAEIAKIVSELTGAQITHLPNPRNEDDKNALEASNDCFLELGLEPTLLKTGLMDEIFDIAKKYAHRCDPKRIGCVSYWNESRKSAVTGGK